MQCVRLSPHPPTTCSWDAKLFNVITVATMNHVIHRLIGLSSHYWPQLCVSESAFHSWSHLMLDLSLVLHNKICQEKYECNNLHGKDKFSIKFSCLLLRMHFLLSNRRKHIDQDWKCLWFCWMYPKSEWIYEWWRSDLLLSRLIHGQPQPLNSSSQSERYDKKNEDSELAIVSREHWRGLVFWHMAEPSRDKWSLHWKARSRENIVSAVSASSARGVAGPFHYRPIPTTTPM